MDNNWLNRTAKIFVSGTDASDMTARFGGDFSAYASNANWIYDPDLTAVAGQPSKYWVITGDVVSLMDSAAQAAVDAAELTASRDAVVAELDQLEGVMRAFMGLMVSELNDHTAKTNAILDAIDAASSLATLKTTVAAFPDLPVRTFAQLKTSLRNRLGS